MVGHDQPVVSVVVSVDFAAGDSETWDQLRSVLKALAEQDFAEPAEVLFVEFAETGTGSERGKTSVAVRSAP